MIKKLALVAFAFLTSPSIFANPNPNSCYLDAGDGGADPKKALFAVEFRGPSNPFWSYVSESTESWSFRIVQREKNSKPMPGFETFSVKVPDNKQIDLKNDLEFKSTTEFQIKPAKVKEIVEAYRSFFEDFRKKNPNKLPSATQQILQFYISFNSPSQNSDEEWLNHHCSIGIGLNRLSIQGVDLPKLEIDVNQPDLSSAEYGAPLPSSFSVETKAGKAELKGLPIGTYIAKLATKPNTQAPVAYLWSLSKTCKIVLKKETEKQWAVSENGCSVGDGVAR